MTVEHYENFPVASVLLPAHLRRAVELIYSFARQADDFADEGDAPPELRLQRLAEFSRELDRVERGQSPGLPLFVDLAPVIAAHHLPVGLFRDLREPVVEQFEPSDKIDGKLGEAMNELLSQEVGKGAMTASLLKQVIIALVRRSLKSSQSWTDRFSILADRQITRAFADMVARPGAAHTVQSLAYSASLSRSAFMARFSEIFGRSPMAILRDLRMRQAALDLATTTTPVDVVARNAGYESRSSFVRAFRKAYDVDPSEYRQSVKNGEGDKGA